MAAPLLQQSNLKKPVATLPAGSHQQFCFENLSCEQDSSLLMTLLGTARAHSTTIVGINGLSTERETIPEAFGVRLAMAFHQGTRNARRGPPQSLERQQQSSPSRLAGCVERNNQTRFSLPDLFQLDADLCLNVQFLNLSRNVPCYSILTECFSKACLAKTTT